MTSLAILDRSVHQAYGGPNGQEFGHGEERLIAQPLAGKVALVTGGSRGLGTATARALADAGADVALQRVSDAAETAATIAFLASPAASYITGAVLDSNGGYTA
ncbi:SDR family oxidoreductase [Micromonospora sp. NPDC049101]|uniref:SDR family oxidoreductase n=1 Tax=Micromonospora sp. NPDC049101 TaxID=3155032 RepID=UPI0033C8A2E8